MKRIVTIILFLVALSAPALVAPGGETGNDRIAGVENGNGSGGQFAGTESGNGSGGQFAGAENGNGSGGGAPVQEVSYV